MIPFFYAAPPPQPVQQMVVQVQTSTPAAKPADNSSGGSYLAGNRHERRAALARERCAHRRVARARYRREMTLIWQRYQRMLTINRSIEALNRLYGTNERPLYLC